MTEILWFTGENRTQKWKWPLIKENPCKRSFAGILGKGARWDSVPVG